MKALRIIKKAKQPYLSVESQSREIIASIFSNSIETDKLELGLKEWSSTPIDRKIVQQNPIVKADEPLKNLLVLLQHLSKGYYLDICSFIFLSKEAIFIVYKDKRITIKKVKNEKSKLKYWFSDIYFTKLRNKLADQLIDQNFKFDQEREVVHFNEEKQYMPSYVSGFSRKKQQSPMVREIKISRSSMYRKQGVQQRQQFCVGYYSNGAQQLFSFSEILSFVEYPFNMTQMTYFKILPKQKDGSNSISTVYSKKHEKNEDMATIHKMKRIFKLEERWKLLKDEFEEMKNTYIKNGDFEAYCRLLMLEIISFVETREFIEVKEIKLEWVVTEDNGILLSNASTYRFVHVNRIPEVAQGLVTLYEKCHFDKSRLSRLTESEDYSRFKKNKTQEKYIGEKIAKLPLLNWQMKKKRKNSESAQLLQRVKIKANSCVLRLGLSKAVAC